MTLIWEAAGLSHTGQVRRGNEDSFRISPERGIFIVADGMGGHAAGEVASQLAADAALETLSAATLATASDVQDSLHAAFREAHHRIVGHAQADPETSGMGTTLTIVVLNPSGALYVGHIGDSRAYLLDGEGLRQLTHDHTWVQQEVDAGRVSPDAAATHPLSHILTRVLSSTEPPEPDVTTGTVKSLDRLLLCSDGLYNMVGAPRIMELMAEEDSPDAAARKLIDAANDGGGMDNITVVAVQIE